MFQSQKTIDLIGPNVGTVQFSLDNPSLIDGMATDDWGWNIIVVKKMLYKSISSHLDYVEHHRKFHIKSEISEVMGREWVPTH